MDAARVLIVEGDRDIAHLIALHLREAGYGVEAVRDGEAGLERAVSGRYDLLVLDVVLPKLSGPTSARGCARVRTRC